MNNFITHMMRIPKGIRSIGVVLLGLYIFSSCGVVPITGRRSLNLVSDAEVLSLSQSQYGAFVSQARGQGVLVRDARVEEISRRLIMATDRYLRQEKLTSLLAQMRWEVNVVRSNQINAFCMPGGKIVVYTGLTKLVGTGVGTDAELAAVIGHEIAHALARHANERLSNAMLTQMGGQILGVAVGSQSQLLQQVIGLAYGLGSNVFVALPFGRKQEYEADKMGLVLMAMAGYDPRYAVSLWQKMARGSKGSRNEFMSTHPSEANRIKAIQAYLPTALKYYGTPTKNSGKRSIPASKVSSLFPPR